MSVRRFLRNLMQSPEPDAALAREAPPQQLAPVSETPADPIPPPHPVPPGMVALPCGRQVPLLSVIAEYQGNAEALALLPPRVRAALTYSLIRHSAIAAHDHMLAGANEDDLLRLIFFTDAQLATQAGLVETAH